MTYIVANVKRRNLEEYLNSLTEATTVITILPDKGLYVTVVMVVQ